MNTKVLIELTAMLEQIKQAKFYDCGGSLVGFSRLRILQKYRPDMVEELNEAIKPVMEKYEEILKNAIREEVTKRQSK